MTTFPEHFLWGAATAGHQIEGNNVNSDWWAREQLMPGHGAVRRRLRQLPPLRARTSSCSPTPGSPPTASASSGRASSRSPGGSRGPNSPTTAASSTHCLDRGITPVVTLQHFTTPQWFAEARRMVGPRREGAVRAYVERGMHDPRRRRVGRHHERAQHAGRDHDRDEADEQQAGGQWQSPTVEGEHAATKSASRRRATTSSPTPIPRSAARSSRSTTPRARSSARAPTRRSAGPSPPARSPPRPAAKRSSLEIRYGKEDIFWEGSRGDDWVGVQAYSSQQVDANGLVPHPQLPDNTLVGTTYRPDSLAMAVRHATEVTQGVPDPHHRERHRDRRRHRADPLHRRGAAGTARDDRRRHRRARLPALVAAGQLRVGPLGAHLRPDRDRPRDVRTHPQAQPRLARRRSRSATRLASEVPS